VRETNAQPCCYRNANTVHLYTVFWSLLHWPRALWGFTWHDGETVTFSDRTIFCNMKCVYYYLKGQKNSTLKSTLLQIIFKNSVRNVRKTRLHWLVNATKGNHLFALWKTQYLKARGRRLAVLREACWAGTGERWITRVRTHIYEAGVSKILRTT
jgi:hypothetical protein